MGRPTTKAERGRRAAEDERSASTGKITGRFLEARHSGDHEVAGPDQSAAYRPGDLAQGDGGRPRRRHARRDPFFFVTARFATLTAGVTRFAALFAAGGVAVPAVRVGVETGAPAGGVDLVADDPNRSST
jgi:hypothetical protein